MIVVWLFFAVPWVRLQFVIVVYIFPDHTHNLSVLLQGPVPKTKKKHDTGVTGHLGP